MAYFLLTTTLLILSGLYLHERSSRLRLNQTERRLRNEQKDLHHSLEEQRSKAMGNLEAVFNSMADGVLILDADDRIVRVNPSLQSIFGIEKELVGQSVMEALRMHQVKELIDQTHIEASSKESEIEFPDLKNRVLRVNASRLTASNDGRSGGAVLVFHDLTESKQLERTRTEFVANVSHELRTPLTLIKGCAETLSDGAIHQPEAAQKFVDLIDKHVNRITFLIEDLLIISKLESGQVSLNLQTVDLNEMVSKILDDFETKAKDYEVQLLTDLEPNISVKVDPNRLTQVFSNLIDNAIKYGGQGGTVTLGSSESDDSDFVTVCVKDSGTGIPKESLERIFERFYRVDQARSRQQGGTGLGLAIVKHIVKSHGGQVWADSDLGEGASFYFTLPTAT